MTTGEIWWAELPTGGGHAQAGRRPAIVLQTARTCKSVPTVLVVPLTTQLDALRFPGTILVEITAKNGLARASVALVFQLTALDQRLLTRKIGTASDLILAEIFSTFDELAGR